MAAPNAPAGFTNETIGSSRIVVDASRRERLLAAGLARPTLLISSARPRAGGRGGAYEITIGGEDMIMRAYRRGGLPRLLWKDTMFDDQRSQREVRALAVARERGVPAVQPVAGVGTSAGLGFYRHYLFTVKLSGAVELLTIWADSRRTRSERLQILESAAQTVKKAFDAGVEPIDLHPRNILVIEYPKLECSLVDLDGAILQNGSLPPAVRITALARFIRFIERHNDDGRRLMSRSDTARFIKIIEGESWRRTLRGVHARLVRTRWLHQLGSLWRPRASGSLLFAASNSKFIKRGSPAPARPAITFIFTAGVAARPRATLQQLFESVEKAGVGGFEVIGVARDGRGQNELRALSLETPCLRFLAEVYKSDGEAWRAGIRAARGERIVVIRSSALDARFLTEALDWTNADADVVVGIRGGGGASDTRSPLARARDSLLSLLLRLTTRAPVSDPLSSFVARRDERFDAAMRAARGKRFVTAEIVGRLAEAGARIREAPVCVAAGKL